MGDFDELRRSEFPQMASGVFVDFGGSFPVSQSSISRMSEFATDIAAHYPRADGVVPIDEEIDHFKDELLSLLNTDSDHYTVFFGLNTSAVLRFVGFAFPFGHGSKFIYHADNHNSILGLRMVALHGGAELLAVGSFPKSSGTSHSLFAFAPQSNFNGAKHPLQWIRDFQAYGPGNAHVLIDCAAYLPSNPLDLTEHQPDFVTFSLLKAFGCAGGVLLIKNSTFPILAQLVQPPFDKMAVVGARAGLQVRRRFEALLQGDLSGYVYGLASDFHSRLKNLRHFNGKPLAILYPEDLKDVKNQGGTIAFNLIDSNGRPIPHDGIFTAATGNRLFLRFGVHCNPGATYMALGWKPQDIQEATQAHEAACSLTASIMEGRHVGSIRISFGFPNNSSDVLPLIAFFESNFVEQPPRPIPSADRYRLAQAIIHPIKGCRGFRVGIDPYRVVKSGLWFDENWGIADELSTFLDRRRCPAIAALDLTINDEWNAMRITAPSGRSIVISFTERPKGTKFTSSTVCHEKINGAIYEASVNDWFTEILGQKAILVRLEPEAMKPFRCFFTASLEAIGNPEVEQLRPHFIFDSDVPFSEDNWAGTTRTLGGELTFTANRLAISTEAVVNLKGGESTEPLHAICAVHPTPGGKVEFGLQLVAQFVPSRKNPKELRLDSWLH